MALKRLGRAPWVAPHFLRLLLLGLALPQDNSHAQASACDSLFLPGDGRCSPCYRGYVTIPADCSQDKGSRVVASSDSHRSWAQLYDTPPGTRVPPGCSVRPGLPLQSGSRARWSAFPYGEIWSLFPWFVSLALASLALSSCMVSSRVILGVPSSHRTPFCPLARDPRFCPKRSMSSTPSAWGVRESSAGLQLDATSSPRPRSSSPSSRRAHRSGS